MNRYYPLNQFPNNGWIFPCRLCRTPTFSEHYRSARCKRCCNKYLYNYTNQPETNQPDTNQSDINQPDTNQSDTNQPDTNQPDINQSNINQPDTNQSDINQPDINQPDTNQPDTNQSDINQPDTNQPDTNQSDKFSVLVKSIIKFRRILKLKKRKLSTIKLPTLKKKKVIPVN
jgi:hypothetical protein